VLVLVLARLVLVGRHVWLLLVLVNLCPHYFGLSPGFGTWGSVYLLIVCIGCSTSTSNVDGPSEHRDSVKLKDKIVPLLNKSSITPWRHMGSGCINPCIFDLGTILRWVVNFCSWLFSPREEEKYLPLQGLKLRPLGRPAYSQSLNWPCYPGSPQRFSTSSQYGNSIFNMLSQFNSFHFLKIISTKQTSVLSM
jgi:hypothetical protein